MVALCIANDCLLARWPCLHEKHSDHLYCRSMCVCVWSAHRSSVHRSVASRTASRWLERFAFYGCNAICWIWRFLHYRTCSTHTVKTMWPIHMRFCHRRRHCHALTVFDDTLKRPKHQTEANIHSCDSQTETEREKERSLGTYYYDQVEITASICVLLCVHVFRYSSKNLWTKRLFAAVLISNNRTRQTHYCMFGRSGVRANENGMKSKQAKLYVCPFSLFRVDTKVYSLLGHIFRLVRACATHRTQHREVEDVPNKKATKNGP